MLTNVARKSGVNTNGCQFKQPCRAVGMLSLSAAHCYLRAGLANTAVELLLQLEGQKCAFYPGITHPSCVGATKAPMCETETAEQSSTDSTFPV